MFKRNNCFEIEISNLENTRLKYYTQINFGLRTLKVKVLSLGHPNLGFISNECNDILESEIIKNVVYVKVYFRLVEYPTCIEINKNSLRFYRNSYKIF